MSLLQVRHLTKTYPGQRKGLGRSRVTVVDDVSLDLDAGRCLAVVGESGAGKSTLGRLVLRLVEPDAGTVVFDGTDLGGLDRRALRRQRRDMQMVFQDPYSSVDPRMTVGQSIAEPFRAHGGPTGETPEQAVSRLLDLVGLLGGYADRYPAELSGGQLQRVSIARALALRPRLVVCDEPVTALDVSVRAQIVNLLLDLRDELGLTYLFVCHDLSVVEQIADDVMVMRRGGVVETGSVADVFQRPREAYTRELLAAAPDPVPPALRNRAAAVPAP